MNLPPSKKIAREVPEFETKVGKSKQLLLLDKAGRAALETTNYYEEALQISVATILPQ
jgi:hypothetical protein